MTGTARKAQVGSRPAVPAWLGHLRTDARGLPVPYVNRWGPEDLDRMRIAYDSSVGGMALFLDDDQETEPDFTRQHMGRQRECMVRGLCQVCARRVPWSRRFLVVSTVTMRMIEVPELGMVVGVHEPWLDERCASFAIEKCPALIRRARGEDLRLIPVTSKRDVILVESIGYVDGPMEEESLRIQPTMWVCVVPHSRLLEPFLGAA